MEFLCSSLSSYLGCFQIRFPHPFFSLSFLYIYSFWSSHNMYIILSDHAPQLSSIKLTFSLVFLFQLLELWHFHLTICKLLKFTQICLFNLFNEVLTSIIMQFLVSSLWFSHPCRVSFSLLMFSFLLQYFSLFSAFCNFPFFNISKTYM